VQFAQLSRPLLKNMSSLIGRIKQNRIGAVVVSVFDWYRESVEYLEE
jgi:hypothetical protein